MTFSSGVPTEKRQVYRICKGRFIAALAFLRKWQEKLIIINWLLQLFFTFAGVTRVFYLEKKKKKKSCLEKLRWKTRGKQSFCEMKCYWLLYLIHKLLFCIFQNIIRLWQGKKLLVIDMELLSSRKIYLNLLFFV